MNIFKSVIRFIGRWWWIPVSVTVALVLTPSLTLGAYWLAYNFDKFWPSDDFASFFQAISFHGLVLFVIATIGIPFTLWRGLARQKQSDAAQSGLLDDRYQAGVEMLGNDKLSARLGGIYTLEHVAASDPFTYHIPAMSVLSVVIRSWHVEDGRAGKRDNTTLGNELKEPPEDVCAALGVIGRRSRKQRRIESERRYVVNLRGACLRGWAPFVPLFAPKPDFSNVSFSFADLSNVDLFLVKLARSSFNYANLSGACLRGADLSYAFLSGADLSNASLASANLSKAHLGYVKLSSTDLEQVKGLTQKQINSANIDAQRLPVLTGAVDSDTKRPLTVPPQSH